MRAHSTLTITKADGDAGIIEGYATTPKADRVGDVVEPAGAEFQLPIPLLMQHDHSRPLGSVIEANVTARGIRVVCRVARGISDDIERSWKLIKAGVVRGLSIGFRGLQTEPLREGGVRFKRWEWLELSAVTVPANAEATILATKRAEHPGCISRREHDVLMARFHALANDVPRSAAERALLDEFADLADGAPAWTPVAYGEPVHLRPPVVRGDPIHIGNPEPVYIPRRW